MYRDKRGKLQKDCHARGGKRVGFRARKCSTTNLLPNADVGLGMAESGRRNRLSMVEELDLSWDIGI